LEIDWQTAATFTTFRPPPSLDAVLTRGGDELIHGPNEDFRRRSRVQRELCASGGAVQGGEGPGPPGWNIGCNEVSAHHPRGFVRRSVALKLRLCLSAEQVVHVHTLSSPFSARRQRRRTAGSVTGFRSVHARPLRERRPRNRRPGGVCVFRPGGRLAAVLAAQRLRGVADEGEMFTARSASGPCVAGQPAPLRSRGSDAPSRPVHAP
jgi:hypothetical protein